MKKRAIWSIFVGIVVFSTSFALIIGNTSLTSIVDIALLLFTSVTLGICGFLFTLIEIERRQQ